MTSNLACLSTKNRNTNLKLARLFYKYTEEKKEETQTTLEETKKEDKEYESYPPYNFSWFIENKIAAMACPQTVANLNFIADAGVDHLITLSPEKTPPILECEKKLKWTEIRIKEFGAPTLKQILKFIQICERAELRGEVLGVHCRQGRGRTGTMLACYLVYRGAAPERAVLTVRVQRPGSCETYEQEKIVCHYHDCVRGTIAKPDYRLVDDKPYFDASMRHMFGEEENKDVAGKQDGGDTTQNGADGKKDGEAKTEEKEKTKRKKSKAMVINHHIYF